MKDNADLFADSIPIFFSECVQEGNYSFCFKKASVASFFKKDSKKSKDNYKLVSKYLQNILKKQYLNNYLHFWIKSFLYNILDLKGL